VADDRRRFLADAAALGFRFAGINGRGHLRLIHEQTGRKYATSATPSDRRSRKNALSDLKRIAGHRVVIERRLGV
jgi:hypothetical protein